MPEYVIYTSSAVLDEAATNIKRIERHGPTVVRITP